MATNGDVDTNTETDSGNGNEATATATAKTGAKKNGNGNGNGKAVAKQDDGPPTDRWVVKLSHPLERKRQVFSSVSEKRARRFIQNRFPRGSEAYLEGPDGSTYSYEAERTGPYGEDMDTWGDFDPESYRPPEEAPPPGESAWGDVEG